MIRPILLGVIALVAVLAGGCSSEEPVELYRVVKADRTDHVFVVPSSVRDNGKERIVQAQVWFSDVRPSNVAARLDLKASQMVLAFDCDRRTFRFVSVTATTNAGKTTKEKARVGTRDVLPESPPESVMEFACSSSVTRAWKTKWLKPKVY